MNFSQLLLEFLQKHNSVSLRGFGTFYLKNTNAVLDESGKSILPPAKEVAFLDDSGDNGADFVQFLMAQESISEIEAEIEIRKQITFWNSTLEKEEKLSVDNLGIFFLNDSKIHFTGDRTENLSPDFYGLEEITISEVKNRKPATNDTQEYSFSKTVYWVIPLVTAVLALTYFGITLPELVFGKKSFDNGFKKIPVQKIKKDTVKADTVTFINPNNVAVPTDTLQPAIHPQKTPPKKWSSKKHINSKWKKAKRQ